MLKLDRYPTSPWQTGGSAEAGENLMPPHGRLYCTVESSIYGYLGAGNADGG